jgi:hypothetical protein
MMVSRAENEKAGDMGISDFCQCQEWEYGLKRLLGRFMQKPCLARKLVLKRSTSGLWWETSHSSPFSRFLTRISLKFFHIG